MYFLPRFPLSVPISSLRKSQLHQHRGFVYTRLPNLQVSLRFLGQAVSQPTRHSPKVGHRVLLAVARLHAVGVSHPISRPCPRTLLSRGKLWRVAAPPTRGTRPSLTSLAFMVNLPVNVTCTLYFLPLCRASSNLASPSSPISLHLSTTRPRS